MGMEGALNYGELRGAMVIFDHSLGRYARFVSLRFVVSPYLGLFTNISTYLV